MSPTPTNEQQDARACGHTEHAVGSGGRVGRHFNGPDPAGYWGPCHLAAVSAAAPASPTTPTPTVSEWGARHEGFVREFGEDEDAARRWVALGSRRWTVVRREVTAWTVADAPAADDEGGQER